MKVINSIRTKDPKIYKESTVWYSEKEDKSSGTIGNGEEKGKKEKKFIDVMRDQLLEGQENGGNEDNEDYYDQDDGGNDVKGRFGYDKDQKEKRSAFLEALNGGLEDSSESEDEEDLLVGLKKKTSSIEKEYVDNKSSEFSEEVSKMVEKGKEDGENEDDKFMADFFLKRKWKFDPLKTSQRIDSIKGALAQDEEDDEEEEEEEDKMEEFERAYNFRFEEEGGGELITYGREVEGSLRRPDERRKRRREEKKTKKEKERKLREVENEGFVYLFHFI